MGGNVSIYIHTRVYARQAPLVLLLTARHNQTPCVMVSIVVHVAYLVLAVSVVSVLVSGYYLYLDLDFTIPSIPSVE